MLTFPDLQQLACESPNRTLIALRPCFPPPTFTNALAGVLGEEAILSHVEATAMH